MFQTKKQLLVLYQRQIKTFKNPEKEKQLLVIYKRQIKTFKYPNK